MIEGCKWQKAKDMKCHCAVQDAQMDRQVRYKARSVKQTEKYFLWTSSLHVDLIINCKVVSKKLEVPLCLFLHSYQVCAIRKRLFWITLKYWQDCTDIHTRVQHYNPQEAHLWLLPFFCLVIIIHLSGNPTRFEASLGKAFLFSIRM